MRGTKAKRIRRTVYKGLEIDPTYAWITVKTGQWLVREDRRDRYQKTKRLVTRGHTEGRYSPIHPSVRRRCYRIRREKRKETA